MVKRKDRPGQVVNTIWDEYSLASISKDIEYEIIENTIN